jgi:hypothetical protein
VGIHPNAAMNAQVPLFPSLPASLSLLAATLLPFAGSPCRAEVESYINKPGSNVGPATLVEPTDCVSGADGSITCDTKIKNPPGDTPAKPEYSPFRD